MLSIQLRAIHDTLTIGGANELTEPQQRAILEVLRRLDSASSSGALPPGIFDTSQIVQDVGPLPGGICTKCGRPL
jgi:hypothetical protein